jgi:hypothetical protein
MATETIEPEIAEDTQESRRRDPELLALERIIRLVESLSDVAQTRVIAYLKSRYMKE